MTDTTERAALVAEWKRAIEEVKRLEDVVMQANAKRYNAYVAIEMYDSAHRKVTDDGR